MISIWRYFPAIKLESSTRKDLKAMGIDPYRYMGMSLILSFVFSLPVLVFFGVYALLAFAVFFGFFLFCPRMEMDKRAAEIESELPFFLRSLGMLIEMGIPFQKALVIAAKGHGILQEEIRRITEDTENGMSLQRAFSSLGRYRSLNIKRAVSQVISAYEVGSSGREMKRIGDELLSIQKHRLKEYSAKSAMIGLLLIISAAVMPTFFLVYAVAGRFAFGTSISNEQIAFAMLVLFPLISVFILLMSKSIMPRSAFSGKRNFDPGLVAPGAIFVLGFLAFPGLWIAFMLIGTATAGFLIYRNYETEKKTESIEEHLPDALFSVSGMPKSAKPEDIFRIIEKGGYGALSEEAGKSGRQIEKNVGIGPVIEDLWKRNPSMMLKRACVMLEEMVHTNSLGKLSMLAEDIISAFQIKREQAQLFSLQKYTLIFGGFLVPLILKVTIYLLENMSGLLEESAVSDAVAFSASVIPPYLIIYSTIASVAIAEAEGKRSSAPVYLLALSAASLLTFSFISL